MILKVNGSSIGQRLIGLKYQPFEHVCPEKSEITFHGVKSKEIEPFYAEVLYEQQSIPNVSSIPREEIKLSGLTKTLIENAKTVVVELKKEWEKGKKLKEAFEVNKAAYKTELANSVRPNMGSQGGLDTVRYQKSLQKDTLKQSCGLARAACIQHPFSSPSAELKTVTNENFLKVYEEVMNRLIASSTISQELKNNKSFEALVTYLSVDTSFNKDGFLSGMPTGFYDYSDHDLISKIRTIGTYALVH